MDYITDLDERGEVALYDDGGEFGDVYVFLINAASEDRLLAAAARIADLPGVPAGVFAQDPLELFQAADPGDGHGDELGEEADPEWIRNSQ